MNDMIAFVQFIHPGKENCPSTRSESNILPWNRGIHRRKFLCQSGWYMNNGQPVHAELTFWGEWEPQSRITRIDSPIEDGGPHVIHHPLLDLDEPKRDALKRCRQNTDPFVFHEQFLYRCCQQTHASGQTQLAHLLPGSIVLFGSRVNNLFAVDTVFVVGKYRDYYDRKGGIKFDPNLKAYAEIVGVGLKGSRAGNCSGCGSNPKNRHNPSQMRLYYGASPEAPYEGMYSFVPCKRHSDNELGWARPTLTRDDMRGIYDDCITDNLQQGRKYYKDATLDGNVAAWKRIRELFAQKGYLEGVRFECPQSNKI